MINFSKSFLITKLNECLNEYNKHNLNDIEASAYVTMRRLLNEIERENKKERFCDLSRAEDVLRGVSYYTLESVKEALPDGHNADKTRMQITTAQLQMEQDNEY